MTTERTVGELRADAEKVLHVVDLESVFLARSSYESQPQTGEIKLVSGFTVQTMHGSSDNSVTAWVRHRAFALAFTEDEQIPLDAAELSDEFVEEHYAWRSETDWAAEFGAAEGAVEQFTSEQLNAFAMVLGPSTVHPYARELVQSLVARGQYPAFSMGLLTPISQLPDDEIIEIEDA